MENGFFLTGDRASVERLAEIYREYSRSVAANAFENYGGFSYVWGCGDTDAPIVMIGEAPGENEVREGRPFVGKAGKILDEFLLKTNIRREELFITNTIKYRLSRPRKGAPCGDLFIDGSLIPAKYLANRPSKEAEIKHGAGFLAEEIAVVSPRIVVTLGNVPLRAVCRAFLLEQRPLGVGDAHGKPVTIRSGADGFVLFPLYHPASLIYDSGKRVCYEEDLAALGRLFRGFRI